MTADRQVEDSAGFGRRPADPALGDKTTFRLAAYGAVLVVVLFAGYGLGRLNNGATSASAPPAAMTAADLAAGGNSVANGAPPNGADPNGPPGNGMAPNAAAGNGAGPNAAAGNGAAPNAAAGNGAPTDGATGNGPAAAGGMPGMAMGGGEGHTHNADGTVTPATMSMPAGSSVGGLSLSSSGLTLVPLRTIFSAGQRQRLTFRITGAGGLPVTTFALVHDRLLHLIVIRRDLTGFQHLHPTMSPDGTWSIDLTLAQPGMYRMIADFTAIVGGRPVAVALGSDLTVAGNYAPVALPAPVRVVHTRGFTVGYEGAPTTESVQPILVGVTGPDRKPAALQPYLGAFGHLVMMREGDLGYVHVHPEAQLVDGKVKFWVTAPSRGAYRMFFDFQVAGQVHTAAWTVIVS